VEIQWTDDDPVTGEKRFVKVERFAKAWHFSARAKRRENWQRIAPTRDLYEILLDSMERRYQRREGIDETEVAAVKKLIAQWKDAPSAE
jgi:hypothetical protein